MTAQLNGKPLTRDHMNYEYKALPAIYGIDKPQALTASLYQLNANKDNWINLKVHHANELDVSLLQGKSICLLCN